MKLIYNTLLALIPFMVVACNQQIDPSQLYQIDKDGLYGYIDENGNVVVEPQYIYASLYFSKDGTSVVVIDTVTTYDESSIYGENRDTFFVKYNYITTDGQLVFDHDYQESIGMDELLMSYGNVEWFLHNFCRNHWFSHGLAIVSDTITWKKGYMDKKGNIIIPCQYTKATRFIDKVASVEKITNEDPLIHIKHYGIIDLEGNEVCDFIFTSMSEIVNDRAFATISFSSWKSGIDTIAGELGKDDEGNVYIDKSKKQVIEKDNDEPSFGWKYYLINSKGHIITELGMMHTGSNYSDDGISVMVPNRLGEFFGLGYEFLDKDGNYLEPLNEDELEFHHKELNDPKCLGYLTKDIDIWSASYFENGFSGVQINNDTWLFLDKNLIGWGTTDREPYQYCGPFNYGIAPVKIDGKWGYVDTTLTVTIPCQYDSCYVAGKELCKVYSSKSDEVKVVSYIRRNGEIVWQSTIVSSFMDKYKPSKPLSNWAMNKKQKRKYNE